MLSHPVDFLKSVYDHNIEDSLILDWLEATCMFLEDELSRTDVVDHLVQEQIFETQDSASEFVLSTWSNLEKRLSWLGSYTPIVFDGRQMFRQLDWRDVPVHSYCLVVSLGARYDDWHATFGPNYIEQGSLFESITEAAMKLRFQGWKFLQTGWSRGNTSKLTAVIDGLISTIDEREGKPDDYLDQEAKDAGVDLIWHLPFANAQGGKPIYLAQCASGKNWIEKVNEPNINEWTKIIDFAVPPSKAFSLPFSLSERELRRQSNRAGGLMVDRYRLLAQNTAESDWVPCTLRRELTNWLTPRIEWLRSK
ncbi:MAG: hypothetical protein F4Y80_06165 [Caldilineaceae bacterium SB0665_bin_21]|nr:hypothetical protein [Caldilineaceae bacterium SB0665_bin_21]